MSESQIYAKQNFIAIIILGTWEMEFGCRSVKANTTNNAIWKGGFLKKYLSSKNDEFCDEKKKKMELDDGWV